MDLVLALDTSGRSGEALQQLRPLNSRFKEFVSRQGNRMAVVGSDARQDWIAQPLTTDLKALSRAITSLVPGPLGDAPKPLFRAFDWLREHLDWRSGSARAIIVVSAAPAQLPLPDSVLEWTDKESVAVTLVQLH